jgi:hypothetical protein
MSNEATGCAANHSYLPIDSYETTSQSAKKSSTRSMTRIRIALGSIGLVAKISIVTYCGRSTAARTTKEILIEMRLLQNFRPSDSHV